MIRTPLRPLARVLRARERGEDPNYIEQENLRLRRQELRDTGRVRAELRLLVLALMFLSGFVLLGARMGLLAATEPVEMRVGLVEGISDTRSDITDRNGRVLATNLATHALYAETRRMVDPVRAARELGRIFPELDADRLAARFTDPDRSFVWVRTRLSPEQKQAVHDIGEPGLLFGPRKMRVYPNGRVAAHILGGARFGEQGVRAAEILGVAGAELYFEERLRDPSRANQPLQLSIDLPLQATITEVLSGGMQVLSARGASAVLMDAHTGEVLSLVSLPDFDPNDRPAPLTEGEPADSPLFNRAVQGYYELGSVMKAFTVAQALEEGDVTPDTIIDTRGPLRWGRFRINDFRDYGSEMSVTKVMVHSSNIGTARMAQEIGAERQQDFLRRFGFLDRMAIELAEAQRARPLLPEPWSELSAMTISYGHGLTTSPLALAAGYAALVNGGRQVTPTLLRRDAPPDAPQVISARSSAQMREILHDVVYEGTASFARIPGYPVGGKTGSADKPGPNGGYKEDAVLATFASVFPSHDPKYVLVVTLDEAVDTTGPEPRRTAGWTAVPISAEITRRVAPMLGLRPVALKQAEAKLQADTGAQ
ncbi:MAG: cell division protein (peptidoglycan synthetase) FtsI [Roseibaca calidilacus]|uniref:Cell division protein (Peptidoglycan synthetase) FtsI n=1 Tax=Roseibaca calidilacus TaxID=1666912 RepID=A0A0P7WF87_9RHOB|nr:penicillin-binding protein 2 [Roseibaca calidilacus]KPP92671.1 MAG: cell division protein (peptidoglycan synthetase) FtsI [Roseibaca calidilacus]CUX80256.1 cell division protein FtsI (penicillin-binding protein 3) [Roseibaca calidilacus]